MHPLIAAITIDTGPGIVLAVSLAFMITSPVSAWHPTNYDGVEAEEGVEWPPKLTSPHIDVREFIAHYDKLLYEQKWEYHERMATACIRLITSTVGLGNGEKAANGQKEEEEEEEEVKRELLSLVGSADKEDGVRLNKSMHARASAALYREGYRKWEGKWRFCEVIFAERSAYAELVAWHDRHGERYALSSIRREDVDYWEELLALTPQRVTDTLRQMREEGGLESAYYHEMFHKRYYKGVDKAKVMPNSVYFRHFVTALRLETERLPEEPSAPIRALIMGLRSFTYMLLNHCYGTMEGEMYDEGQFVEAATWLARRYYEMDEKVKEELNVYFPKASLILRDPRLHRIYHRLFHDATAYVDHMFTKAATVCHMLKKLALVVAFIDIVPPHEPTHANQINSSRSSSNSSSGENVKIFPEKKIGNDEL